MSDWTRDEYEAQIKRLADELHDAADEIERLRERLAKMREAFTVSSTDEERRLRAALERIADLSGIASYPATLGEIARAALAGETKGIVTVGVPGTRATVEAVLSEFAGAGETKPERECACIPLAPRTGRYCCDCGGRIAGAESPASDAPNEPRLPCDVRVGAVTFRTGVPVRALQAKLDRDAKLLAEVYDDAAKARHAIACAISVWGESMTGDGADGDTMNLLRRAIARTADQPEGGYESLSTHLCR